MAPSLVTWPTISTAVPLALAKRTSAAVHSRSWVTAPAALGTAASAMVWMESTTSSAGRCCSASGQHGVQVGFGQQLHALIGPAQAPRAQRHLRGGLLAGGIQHRRARGQRLRHLQQQRGLADAGLAAEQGHRTRDQAAAQHPVQLAEAHGQPRRDRRARRLRWPRVSGASPADCTSASRGPGRRRACPAGLSLCGEAVPLAAMRTLTLPFGGLAMTGVTDVDGAASGQGRNPFESGSRGGCRVRMLARDADHKSARKGLETSA